MLPRQEPSTVAHRASSSALRPPRRSLTEPVDRYRQSYSAYLDYAEGEPSDSPVMAPLDRGGSTSRHVSTGSLDGVLRASDQASPPPPPPPPPPPHRQLGEPGVIPAGNQREFNDGMDSARSASASPAPSVANDVAIPARRHLSPLSHPNVRQTMQQASYSLENGRPRSHTPLSTFGPPGLGRPASIYSGHPLDGRPASYVDLLNLPYQQQAPPPSAFDNSHLREAVGNNAALLSHKQSLEMYRASAKKTTDTTTLYSFAIFLVSTANNARIVKQGDENTAPSSPNPARDLEGPHVDNHGPQPGRAELLREARQILQRISDRSPFAQYYLADGYSSGVFSKGKEDYDRAFPLFLSASKHGHAESGYRVGLCYELGWGCRKDPAKAVQFYRQSASKNHPGAMTRLGLAFLYGDLGLPKREREMFKWLKRAAEAADAQHSAGPYELGLLHEAGYGEDIFKDESYAAQLYTMSADLGHAQAALRLGQAYEHGELNCPRDSALSVHFYNVAAQNGEVEAMMSLCAWYLVGAEPTLEKDENEAYEWAHRAAELGMAKAQYAVGYFTESGIGCRRDPLEANVWYVKAADQGDERAKHRLDVIRAAATGDPLPLPPSAPTKGKGEKEDKPCLVM